MPVPQTGTSANSRGLHEPYVRGRVIDLSPVARRALGMGGLAMVCLGDR